nr:MAG TPA: MqsA [Bacteriophage sp.]
MCEFCDGKEKRIENGFTYANAYITKNQLSRSYSIHYDNSADEYGYGAFEINYCPICGRKLVEE